MMPGRAACSSRRLILLGSTGSIGINALRVVAHLRREQVADFDVVGLAAGANAALLAEQAAQFGVEHAALAGADGEGGLASVKYVYMGPDAALLLISAVAREGDLVLGAMVGSAGVPATIAAIERGCDIALANKETLVAAGALVVPLAQKHGVKLIPVDSEHNAIAQCLRAGRSVDEVRRLVLTASGGPFRAWPKEKLLNATVAEALNHPTWNMGRKVTIDSASMMNKALEVIEAHWLFGLPAEKIDVIVHAQSLVHSFVEFVDGSVLAQLSPPDMKTPIQCALTWPDRLEGCSQRMDWTQLKTMDFEPVDHERFPAVALARRVIDMAGTAGAVLNAANEEAVGAFLDGRISFGTITDLVRDALAEVPNRPIKSLDDVLGADETARAYARAYTAAAPDAAPIASPRGQ